jgi:hypothetical protein
MTWRKERLIWESKARNPGRRLRFTHFLASTAPADRDGDALRATAFYALSYADGEQNGVAVAVLNGIKQMQQQFTHERRRDTI